MVGLGLFFYSFFVVQEVHEISANVLVQREVFGFNSDTDAIHFGSLKAGTQSARFIKVSSKVPSWVTIQVKGDLAPWIWVSNQSFILKDQETRKITFKVNVPDSAKEGNYTGKVLFIFKEPWVRRLEMFK